ncbi:MAG: hypothetical protein HY849_10580 [Nitrosomonadales bacterium]|nr:hypothetical protein [Nitrosomonadales bacterium]
MRKSSQEEAIGLFSTQSIIIFMLSFGLLLVCALWPVYNGYVSDAALLRMERVMSVLASPVLRIEDFRLLYPHFSVVLLLPFGYMPEIIKSVAPYIVSSFFGAVLLALWNVHLQAKHYPLFDRMVLVLLVAVHPFFLWGVTSGMQGGLSLMMFYGVYLGSVRVIKEADARAFIMLAAAFGAYFFVDERAFFIYFAFLPLLPLIAPPSMLRSSPASLYLIVSMPLLLSVLAWVVYLTFVLSEGAIHFMNAPGEPFRGAWHLMAEVDWLRDYGGTFFQPLIVSLIVAVIAYPVVGWLIWRSRRHAKLARDIEALPLHLSVAVAMATTTYFLAHPADMLYLMAGGVMAAIVLIPREDKLHRRELFLAFLLSAVGGLFCLFWKPTVDMQRWTQAWQGEKLGEYFPGDVELGKWLDANRAPTLIDEHAAYRAIVARGDAYELVLSSTKEFKRALQSDLLTVEQVVVRDPLYNHRDRTGYGNEVFSERLPDSITWHFSDLYRDGMRGYRLVYDDAHWRVYRRTDDAKVDSLDMFPEASLAK